MELSPGLEVLGRNFGEAAELRAQHRDAAAALRAKESPVEDLLRQADQLIEEQKPGKAEVYAAMAQSLGAAWGDLNRQLDRRGAVLEHNYLFQGHFRDYKDRILDLERLCVRPLPPPAALRSEAAALAAAKRAMLEASAFALQEGDSLSAALDAVVKGDGGLAMDSRPGVIKQAVNLAVGQVGRGRSGEKNES